MRFWLGLGVIIWLGLTGLLPSPAAAQEPVPAFEDFPVAEIYRGAAAPLDLADNRAAQEYRTRLSQAAQEKPNFAGHFILTNWGCGAACVQTAIIDAQTGLVFMLPFYVCCWSGMDDPLEYRLDSSLLVIRGRRNEQLPEAVYYYHWNGGQLELLQTLELPPPALMNQPGWANYTNSNTIQALALEGDYVWAGTSGGLVRWNRRDGSYVKYTLADGLPTNDIWDIALDPKGQKWLATPAGVVRFDGQNWVTYTTADGLANDIVYAIVAEPNGHIWAGTDLGLSFYDGQGWKVVSPWMEGEGSVTRPFVKALALDQQGRLWIGTEGTGLSRLALSEPTAVVETGQIDFDKAAWKTYTEADGLLSNRISKLAIGQAGQVWAGTPFGLSRFDGQHWTNFTQADGLPSRIIKALAVDPAGRIWVSAHSYQGGGVSWFDGQHWNPFLSEDGLNDQAVLALAGDEQGFLWLGTNGAGLKQQSLPSVDAATQPEAASLPEQVYRTQDGPAGDGLWTVVTDTTGRLWFGTRGNGLTIFDGQTWQHHPHTANRVSNEITTILLGAEGAIWVGTTQGLSHFDGQHWTSYTYDDGLASSGIAGLALEPSGRLWAATTSEGVSVFDGQSWTTYTTAQGLADNFVHAVAVDKNGRVWFGTNTGVSVLDGQTWRTFTAADGLADDLVWAIVVDPANHIWLGTSGGLSELVLAGPDNATPQWTTHLAGRTVDTLTLDPAGQVWTGGSGHIYRFDGQAWFRYDFPTPTPLRIEGLAFDSAGQVWVATFDEGAIRFDPATWPTVSP